MRFKVIFRQNGKAVKIVPNRSIYLNQLSLKMRVIRKWARNTSVRLIAILIMNE